MLLSFITVSQAFTGPQPLNCQSKSSFALKYLRSDDLREEHARKESMEALQKAIGGVLEDLTGMWNHWDDVVDDFFYNRMGAGEQWNGKRKYNPSGKYNGVYNGMGRSDHIKIQIARAIREEREEQKQARLAKEQDQE